MASAKKTAGPRVLGRNLQGPLSKMKIVKSPPAGPVAHLLVLGEKESPRAIKKHTDHPLLPWELEEAEGKNSAIARFTLPGGPLYVVRLKEAAGKPDGANYGWLDAGAYGVARDQCGVALRRLRAHGLPAVHISFGEVSPAALRGALVGLEMAAYRFLEAKPRKKKKEAVWTMTGVSAACLKEAEILGQSVNLTRHLVNLPANQLHPTSYSDTVKGLFSGNKSVRVEVWKEARLKKEKAGLILGVGGASEHPPCLVHVRWRPPGAGKKKPVAFVGKGITFDTGGLDIKPSGSMRLMKKDMGGSAAVLGLAWWVINRKLKQPCDFWLPMAENAVDSRSIRPGDVLTARNGQTVEIHNTDAEGRLILADALDAATDQKGANKPGLVVDIATLTGAARVGVGTAMGALFTTENKRGHQVLEAGSRQGDFMWPMPLYEGYEKGLKTVFADVNHCSTSRYAGASTAALFLKRFTRGLPWVHLDIMGWSETGGALSETGGNGQSVQCLAEFISQY